MVTDADGQNEEIILADDVYVTIPANQLAPLLESSSPTVANELQKIQFASMGVVHVGFNENVLSTEGFGYLVPSREKEKVLGVVYDSNAFPLQNASVYQTRLSVMCGGMHSPWIEKVDHDELLAITYDALNRHLKISQQPDFTRCLLLQKCIPQYHVGFWKTVDNIEKSLAIDLPGLALGGNSYYGVGVADCVSHSKSLALAYVKKYE